MEINSPMDRHCEKAFSADEAMTIFFGMMLMKNKINFKIPTFMQTLSL